MDELEKQMAILELLDSVEIPPPLMNYFDYDSEKLLDKKIEVLQRLKDGESIDNIEGGYSIFELLPEGQHWD
jgi:hypothetical protein